MTDIEKVREAARWLDDGIFTLDKWKDDPEEIREIIDYVIPTLRKAHRILASLPVSPEKPVAWQCRVKSLVSNGEGQWSSWCGCSGDHRDKILATGKSGIFPAEVRPLFAAPPPPVAEAGDAGEEAEAKRVRPVLEALRDNDLDEPIADNGMTVGDGLKAEAAALLASLDPPQPWLVTCDECQGSAVQVIGHGHFSDGSENNEDAPCTECDGTGKVEVLTTTSPSPSPSQPEGGAETFEEIRERCAEVADEYARNLDTLIGLGKGEHGTPGYVRDETWAGWVRAHIQSVNIASTIRALSPSAAPKASPRHTTNPVSMPHKPSK